MGRYGRTSYAVDTHLASVQAEKTPQAVAYIFTGENMLEYTWHGHGWK